LVKASALILVGREGEDVDVGQTGLLLGNDSTKEREEREHDRAELHID
jgi:hypothetical protein